MQTLKRGNIEGMNPHFRFLWSPPLGNVDCCKLLFEKVDGKAMLAQKTKSGSTPLHSAAVTNRHDVIRLLLDNGSDEKAEDDDGLTAYDQAKVEAPNIRTDLNPKSCAPLPHLCPARLILA